MKDKKLETEPDEGPLRGTIKAKNIKSITEED